MFLSILNERVNNDVLLAERFVKAVSLEKINEYIAQSAHWNIVGSNFPQYHALFEESYTVSNEAIDGVAEQAVILGRVMPIDLYELLRIAGIREEVAPEGDMAKFFMQRLLDSHTALKQLYDDIAANDNGDAGANDLASTMSGKHAKMAWKYRSTLGGQQ